MENTLAEKALGVVSTIFSAFGVGSREGQGGLWLGASRAEMRVCVNMPCTTSCSLGA